VHTRSGFGELHLRASAKASDTDQMFAMGYLEGWLTAERVYDHFHNMRAFFNMMTPKPMQWCAKHLEIIFQAPAAYLYREQSDHQPSINGDIVRSMRILVTRIVSMRVVVVQRCVLTRC